MKYTSPTLVVAGYNRLEPIKRALKSLSQANYPDSPVNMVISIDNDNKTSDLVAKYAEDFNWKYGNKEVILHKENLGIKNHFNFCGDLTAKYGCVVFIEDDLYVAKDYYDYILQALATFENDERIAGISLFNYQRTEQISNPYPFNAIDDGGDNYFMQQASWGQIWTKEMWDPYKKWFNEYGNNDYINSLAQVPGVIKKWPATSWKKHYITYMILHDKYYVFPRIALCSNFDDPGTNRTLKTVYYQSPMLLSQKKFQFKTFDESISIYDSFFELLPEKLKELNPSLEPFDFEVNLYNSKNLETINKEWILGSGIGAKVAHRFSKKMKPHELNIIYNMEGKGINLTSKEGYKTNELINKSESFIYYYRNLLSIKEMRAVLKYKLNKKLNRI